MTTPDTSLMTGNYNDLTEFKDAPMDSGRYGSLTLHVTDKFRELVLNQINEPRIEECIFENI